jgi:hypothetical protein
MFKEVVSLAIILGFILNILYVDHPNTNTYTAAFVLSLLLLSPGVAVVLYRRRMRERRERNEMDEMSLVIAEAAGVPLISAREGVVRSCCVVKQEEHRMQLAGELDVERGLVASVVQAERGERCAACD